MRSTFRVYGFFTVFKVRINFNCFPDFCRALSSTCQQEKKTQHYCLLQELARFGLKTFYSFLLFGNVFLFIFKFIHSLKYIYRLSRLSIALSLTRVFPVFHIARRTAFFLAVICALSYLCCVFILTFECPSVNAPWYQTVAPHCHKTGTIFLVRDVGSACELFFLHHILVFALTITIFSGSFSGRHFHIIPHYHFMESQTSTELASHHNFRFLWKRPNADHRNCVLHPRL